MQYKINIQKSGQGICIETLFFEHLLLRKIDLLYLIG